MVGDKFLVAKGKAGMGNRFLALLDSILYTQLTNRKIVVDWSDETYSNNRSNVFPNYFNLHHLTQASEIPSTQSVNPSLWKNNLEKSVNEVLGLYESKADLRYNNPRIWAKYTTNMSRIDYSEDVLIRWSFLTETYKLRQHFSGDFAYLQRLSNETILKKIIRENLSLQPNIQATIKKTIDNSFEDNVMGVHVRYTDRKSSINTYLNFIDKICEKDPKILIFLATDNKEVEDFFRTKYTNILVTDKWYPMSGSSLHQNPECPDRFENGVQALVDIYLLSKCNYLIYDKTSTFGVVAKLISDIPETNTIETSQYTLRGKVKNLISWLREKEIL
ncbi:MAG: nodulation protein NodZ [Nostoc sp.]|uniref:nodulation protein NodZ n=1 Tax=Nostoc sp. TaxID=1180 RepID=UPI002FF97115